MVGDVDLFIEEEESFRIDGPMWRRGVELDRCNGVRLDVGVEFLSVHDDCSAEDGDREECCSEG